MILQPSDIQYDPEDEATVLAYRWVLTQGPKRSKTVYATTRVGPKHARKTLSLHRLIAGALPGQVVDHLDGNGLNNRRANLKVTTQVASTWRGAVLGVKS
jgi:hypothetical protein